MAELEMNFGSFLANFQKNNVVLSSIASKLEKASDATERTEILKNEENSERLRSIRQSLDFISRSEESLESFQKQAVSAGFDYEKLNKSLRAMEKTFEKMSKMDLDPSLVTAQLVGVIDDSSSSLEKVIRDMSFDLMENANPLFKTLNILDKRMENLSKTVDNQTTFLTSGVDNYREMVDYSSRIISLMKEKKSDLVRILEEAPQRLESLKQRETQLLSQVREITLFKELKQRESELESEKTTLAEAPQKIEQLKERETTLESKTVGVARLGELRDKESELRTRESETRESTEMSSEEKDRALQAISVEMDQIQLELNTSEILREVASMTEDQVLAISTELEEVRAEISRLPENEEARLEAFRQVENKLSEIGVALDGIPMEVKSLTKEQIESITGELNGVQHEIGKLPKTLEERSAVARTLEEINRSINTISDGLKENIEYSPVVKVVTEGLKPVNKAMEKMAFDIAFREAAYGEIDKMGWFRVMSEISLNKKETKILEDQEKLLRKQLIEIDERSDINEEEKILMKKKTMETLENVSGEKEKRVGRGEKLEERRKQGAFAKFFDGIKKSLDGLSSRLKEAAGSWVTKLLLGLFVFGFLIKRGLISTDTVAKVLSFLLKLLVEGLKVAVELIFVGLGAVFGVITDLFKNGDYLGGILLTLAVTLTSLLVLGKVIALATSLWSGIVMGAGALKMGFNFLKETFGVMSSVWNSSLFQKARSGLLGGISSMFSGITTAIKNTSKGAFDTIKNTLTNTFGKGIGDFFGGLLPKKKTPSLMPETPAAGPKKSIWTTIGDALKALGTNEALKGAAVVAILAGAIFLVAKAFEAFTRVSWEGVGKGFVALTALVGIALFVKQIKNDILQGSIAIAALGLAMLGLGYGLIQFNEIGLGAIFKGLAALTALIFIARLVKEQATNIIIGALAIGILAAALIPLGFALSLISGVGVGQIIAFAVAVGLLAGIAALAGSGFALIAMGAGALALLGLSMLAFIPIVRSLSGIDASSLLGFATAVGLLVGIAALAGLGIYLIAIGAGALALLGLSMLAFIPIVRSLSGIDASSLLGFATAIGLLVGIAALAGLAIGLITLGSAALLILAAGLAASIYLIGLAINSLSGVDFGIITPFSEGIWTLARAVMWLAPFFPLIILGSVALAALGVAIMPFAKAMSILNGVVIDLKQVANLDEAIRILAWRAVKEAAFVVPILAGALAIGALGLAVLPFAQAMNLLNGFVIDLQQVANLDEAIRILAWRAVKEAAFVLPILAGALAIGALGLAVLPFAQAMNLLNGVSIDLQQIANLDEAIRILAWRAVKEAAFILPIMLGSLAMQLLANALSSFLPFIDFLVKSKFDMNQMLLFSQAVAILTFSAVAAGLMLIPVLLGSFVLGVLARSLENFIPLIKSLKGVVEIGQIIAFAVAVGLLVGIAALAGSGFALIAMGAGALALLGLSMLTFIPIVRSLSGIIDASSLLGFATAVGLLVGIAALAGLGIGLISLGSAALLILAAGLAASIYLIGPAMNSLSGVDFGIITPFSEGIWTLARAVMWLAPFFPLIILGSVALAALGVAIMPFAKAMSMLNGVSIDLQQIANLDKAIQILAWRAVKEAAFVLPILAGALAIGALGLAVLPFAQAMNLLNGVVIDLQQIANLDEAIRILAWRAVKEAPFILPIMLGSLAMQLLANALSSFLPFIDFLVKSKFDMNQMLLFSQAVAILTSSAVTAGLMLIPVLLGSLVLGVLARSLENFIPIINSLKGVDGNAVMGFGMSVMRVVRAAVYAGSNLIGVYLGANALDYLGKKLVPFASVLQYLHGVDPKSMIAFSFAIRSLVVSAFHAGRFLKEIKDGSGALAVLGSSLTGFANTFSMLSSVNPKAIISFGHSVVSLTFLAIYAGSHQKEVFRGSISLEVLAGSLTSFVNRMKEVSEVSPESMLSFASTVRRLLDTAVLAGLLFPFILLGSIGLLLLGNSLTMFGESLSKIKGLKTEDADAFSYSIKKMIDLIKDIGFFEGLEIVAKVSLVGGSLKEFGESLIPFGVAMSNLGNFDPNSLSTISRGINDLVNEMLYLGEYGDTTAFTEFFGSLVEIAPAIESFSAVMNYFGSALTSVNREMFTFTDLLSQLTHLPDPLYELADSLHELSLSLGEMRTTISSISDEDMLKIIRVFGLTTTMSTQGARRTTLEGRSTSRFMSDRSTPSMSSTSENFTSEWREYTIANELATPGKPLSELQVAAIDTALSMSENNAKNYPSWVLDDYARQKGRERTTLPKGTDFVPSSRTSRNLVTDGRAAVDTMATSATGVPDSQRLEKQLADLVKRGPISRSGQAEDVHREQIAAYETAIRVAKARESRATPATTMVADGRAAVDTMATTGATVVKTEGSNRLEQLRTSYDQLKASKPTGSKEDHEKQLRSLQVQIAQEEARVNPERAKAIMELVGKTPGSHSVLVDALASPDFMRESTSNVVGITPEAKTLVEIKTILFETKEMQMQSNERGGNAVIMQNNNANVSNNTSQANVTRPMTPVDRFFSRMKFRHQIS